MVDLTKPGESAVISLDKSGASIEVEAQWGGGANQSARTDLDLRCSVLLPDGSVYLIDGELAGSRTEKPFVFHHGDILSGSDDAPGVERITVASDISKRLGEKVALVFSVYSALDNGDVSVASLRPIMVMKYGDQVINCKFDFLSKDTDKNIYTYVIGQAVIDGDEVSLSPSGETSKVNGEETPWPVWQGDRLEMHVNGPAVFKGSDSAAKGATYNKRASIKKRFANVGHLRSGGGFFSKLLGGS